MKKKEVNYKARRNWMVFLSVVFIGLFFLVSNNSSGISLELKGNFPVAWSLGILFFMIGFYAIDHLFNIKFEFYHYLIFIAITLLSLMLSPVYFLWAHYDKLLHLLQPFLLSFIIFHLVSHIKVDKRLQILFTFFITISIAGVFAEIAEYLLDILLDARLQGVYTFNFETQLLELRQSRIDDTMVDMMLGLVGSTVYAIGFLFLTMKQKKTS